MEVRCGTCDAELSEGASFCPSCGSPTGTASVPGSPATPIVTTSPPPVTSVRLGFLQWPAAQQILSVATILMFIALLLPWWTVTAVFLGSVSINGFHSWGWLSFVGWLAILALTIRLIAGPRLLAGTTFGSVITDKLLARGLVVAGAVELLGTVFFILVAPTGSGTGFSAGISSGVVIAMITGVAVVYSGLLMISPSWLPRLNRTARSGSSS